MLFGETRNAEAFGVCQSHPSRSLSTRWHGLGAPETGWTWGLAVVADFRSGLWSMAATFIVMERTW